MRLKLELGRRIQLLSMDSHCANITVGLYEQADDSGRPRFELHSYASHPEASARLAFLATAMVALAGMESVPGNSRQVRWPCRSRHLAATKRVFVEACKLSKPDQLVTRPLSLNDPKLPGVVRITPHGQGRYSLGAESGEGDQSRLKTIGAGYLKLAEMERWEQSETGVRFECGHDHDALMGLLIYRALNARAALRELEMMASRGVLIAPSAQAQASS